MDERKIQVETVSKRCRTFGTTGIGGNDDGILVVEVFTDVTEGRRFRVEAGG